MRVRLRIKMATPNAPVFELVCNESTPDGACGGKVTFPTDAAVEARCEDSPNHHFSWHLASEGWAPLLDFEV